VVERGAAGFPTYDNADVVGSWTGPGARVDANYNEVQKWEQRLTVNADLTLSTSNSLGEINPDGDISITNGGGFGTYRGVALNSSGGPELAFDVLMSPDKLFIAAWGEDDLTTTFPRTSYFVFLTKQ
jgi:hypothetical protein